VKVKSGKLVAMQCGKIYIDVTAARR